MPSWWATLACLAVMTAYWTGLGAPIAHRLFPRPLALPLAPALGWAIHTGIALVMFRVIAMSATAILGLSIVLLIGSLAAARWAQSNAVAADRKARVPGWAYGAALLLAIVPMAAVMPKVVPDGIALSAPIFDHSKIALIDEMVRSGFPPANPFLGSLGGAAPPYFYAWHFSAAELALVLGLDGWTADAALTGFTAFSSLALMMGLAVFLAGRSSAAILVLPLSLAGSARVIFNWLFGPEKVDQVLSTYPGLAGWLIQASWAPQHLCSAACVVLAGLLVARLARSNHPLTVVSLALVAWAAFASSTWIGGVVLGLAMPAVAGVAVWRSTPEERRRLALGSLLAAGLTLALAFPLIRDQYLATTARDGGWPIAVQPYEVIGSWLAEPLRGWLDLPAFWLLLLPVTFPAIALTGSIWLVGLIRSGEGDADRRRDIAALAALALVSVATSWLLVSTIGNNDLGWRAILPAILIVTAAAAAALSGLLRPPPRLAAGVALAVLSLGALDAFYTAQGNVTGRETHDAREFEEMPELWAAVRRHTAPTDRLANNPLMLEDMLPWPVNISWALLSRRRTCYAGWELTRAFAGLPKDALLDIDAQFIRVFAGRGSEADVRDLRARYGCTLIVVTPEDGIWSRDVLGATGDYALVEGNDRWRLYRAMPAEPLGATR